MGEWPVHWMMSFILSSVLQDASSTLKLGSCQTCKTVPCWYLLDNSDWYKDWRYDSGCSNQLLELLGRRCEISLAFPSEAVVRLELQWISCHQLARLFLKQSLLSVMGKERKLLVQVILLRGLQYSCSF